MLLIPILVESRFDLKSNFRPLQLRQNRRIQPSILPLRRCVKSNTARKPAAFFVERRIFSLTLLNNC
jgi:hypothetical protein